MSPAASLTPEAGAALSAATPVPRPDARRYGSVEEMQKAAQEFEAVFLAQAFEAMWADMPVDGPFGGGFAEGTFRSLMNQEYAKAITAQGGIGLADTILRELIAMQEGTR